MTAVFLFGTLLDEALRAVVAGTPLPGRPATLPGWQLRRAAAGDYPVLAEAPGAAAEGLLVEDVAEAVLARLDHYESGFAYRREEASVETAEGPRPAWVYRPETPDNASDEGWSLAAWQRAWGPLTREAAAEAMAHEDEAVHWPLRQRMPTIRLRAASRLRARANPSPLRLRRGFTRDSVVSHARRLPYSAYFALQEDDLSHPHFTGGESPRLTRAALVSGDAVTVLPYDPVRDRVLLVEQFRYAPYVRGDLHPWTLEPVAGRIDPGETPDQAALRETREEAGLVLDRLLPAGRYYVSPGAMTEYLYSYIGLCDLPDGAGLADGGKDDEGEDIRGHVLSFAALMGAVESGEAENGPLLISAYWLARERDRLRG